MAQLGSSLQDSEPSTALQWLHLAAERGDLNAQAQLGQLLLRSGGAGSAEAWLQRAADRGHATAQNELGMALLVGALGRPPNVTAAATRLTSSARQGHAMAQTNLGFCFVEGRGVEQ